MRSGHRRLRWGLLGVLAHLTLACDALPARKPEPRPRPNILLVTIDTVRADHTSLHGYERDTTPFLRELGSQGVRFERAYASSSWTVPSVASLLTSLDPATHGVNDGFVQHAEIINQQVLSADHRLLAEVLRDAGYWTVGVTANGHLTQEFGFAQGFDRYANVGFATSSLLNAALDPLIPELRAAEPWFLWVHYFDPHGPFVEQARTREYLADEAQFDEELFAELQTIDLGPELTARNLQPGNHDHRYLNALYDGEIQATDEELRSLVARLGVGADDMIVVTADHGEEFGDHGDCWHGHSLHEELIRVPLVIRFPGQAHAAEVVKQPISLTDLLPTILEQANLAAPEFAQGASLTAFIGDSAAAHGAVRSSLSKVGIYEALIDDRFKYVHDINFGEHALYDLLQDPREQRNLLHERPDVVTSMRGDLGAALLGHRAFVAETLPLAADHVEKLRALGYVN